MVTYQITKLDYYGHLLDYSNILEIFGKGNSRVRLYYILKSKNLFSLFLFETSIHAIRIFLQVEKDKEVVSYNKLFIDALKVIQDQKMLRLQQLVKIQKFQLQLLLQNFNFIGNLSQLQEQYFKEKHKIRKDHFIKSTIQIANNKVDREKALNQENYKDLYELQWGLILQLIICHDYIESQIIRQVKLAFTSEIRFQIDIRTIIEQLITAIDDIGGQGTNIDLIIKD